MLLPFPPDNQLFHGWLGGSNKRGWLLGWVLLVAAKYLRVLLGFREHRRQKSEMCPFDPLVPTAPGLGCLLMIVPPSPICPSLPYGLWIFESCLRKPFLTQRSYLYPPVFSPPSFPFGIWHQLLIPSGNGPAHGVRWDLLCETSRCPRALTSASRLFAACSEQTVSGATDSS